MPPNVSWTLYSSAKQPELLISPNKLYLYAQGTHPNALFPEKKVKTISQHKKGHLISLQIHSDHFSFVFTKNHVRALAGEGQY